MWIVSTAPVGGERWRKGSKRTGRWVLKGAPCAGAPWPLHFHCVWMLKTQSIPKLYFCLLFCAYHTREPGDGSTAKSGDVQWRDLGGFLNSYRSRKNSSRNSPLPTLATPQTHQLSDWDLSKRALNVESFRKAFLMKDHGLCPFHKVCYSFAWKKSIIDTQAIIRAYVTLNWNIYLWSPAPTSHVKLLRNFENRV